MAKRTDEMFKRGGAIGFMLLTLSLIGCERSTQVKLKGGTSSVFDLSGSGIVECFTVFGPDFMTKAEKPFDENFAIWKIAPSGGFHGTWIFKLGSITYGVVPDGYTQIIPKEGTPPRLMEGQKYLYVIETANAPGASGYFEIRKSKAVPTIGSGPCFQDNYGKWVRVPCPKVWSY